MLWKLKKLSEQANITIASNDTFAFDITSSLIIIIRFSPYFKFVRKICLAYKQITEGKTTKNYVFGLELFNDSFHYVREL